MIQFTPEVPKKPSEILPFSMDLVDELGTGESITSSSWAVQVYSGVDPHPEAMLSGASTHSGTVTSQTVIGGLEGVVYLFLATVVSPSRTLVGRALLKVATL